MILIKNIEIVEVEGNRCEIIEQYFRERFDPGFSIPKNVNLTAEMVYGREYRTVDGRNIIISMSERVQELIGLPYEAFDNLHHNIDRMTWELANINKQLKRIKDMNFWNRLKALFYGYK